MINKNKKKDIQCVLIRIGGSAQNTICRLRRKRRGLGICPNKQNIKKLRHGDFLIWCKWVPICVACYSTEMGISVACFSPHRRTV